MPQKPLDPEVINKARELRSEGQTLLQIASQLGISQGSVSNVTRDIEKPAKSPQSHREAPKTRAEAKDTSGDVVAGPYDKDTKELANELKRAEIQEKLEAIEVRKGYHQDMGDLRVRERKLMLQIDELRLGANKGDPGVVTELAALRLDISALREERHTLELKAQEDRHELQMSIMRAALEGGKGSLSRYDLMSQALGKAEGAFIHLSDKVDKFLSAGRGDSTLKTALSMGLSLDEYHLLAAGPERIPSEAEWTVMRAAQARAIGEKVQVEGGEYEQVRQLYQRRNAQYEAVAAKARANLAGGSAAIGTARVEHKTGQVPSPGEPEPVILKAESKLVRCTRCGCEFDIDLAEVKQRAAGGKRLYVHCANPKCNFLLDLGDLLPELQPAPGQTPVADRSTTPKCYVAGWYGECASELKDPAGICGTCAWLSR
ncbi:hypothetical protein ES703_35285 [subsurface metagenome]